MTDEKLKRFVRLEWTKRTLKADLASVEEELGALEEQLLKEFADAGMANAQVDGMTVYLHRQSWAKAAGGDYARACVALEMAGLGELVEPRFNSSTLSAWVREKQQAGEELPEEFKGSIDVSEVFSLRTRKA